MKKTMSREASEYQQMTLDAVLSDNPNGFVNYEVSRSDIGGQLLPLISQGLYTDPLHCVREYVQNSVDAGAKQVKVQITGNSVIIHDDGTGMNATELLEARRFGISPKSLRQNVGFRGIGIYSGYNLCNRLLITTKRSTEAYQYVLEFDFGAMKKQLADDEATGQDQTPLADLIEANSHFSREYANSNQHYTTVILEDISDFHIKQLADRTRLRNYILHNLPVDFDEDFKWRSKISDYLERKIPGFRAVRIVLESPGAKREVVAKPAIPDLDEPILEPIVKVVNGKPETVAHIWASLRNPSDGSRGKIPEDFKEFRGFVYKVKGFTVGTNAKLKSVFGTGGGTLYDWYAGEIYVIDPEVIPNAERNDFEANAAKESLEKAVFERLKILQGSAASFQAEGRALKVFRTRFADLERIAREVSDGTRSELLTYRDLSNIVDELKTQLGKLPSDQKPWGQEVLKRARDLKRQVGGDIDNPQPAPKQRKQAARRRNQEDHADAARDREQSLGDSPEQSSNSGSQFDTPAPDQHLSQAVEEAGWTLSEECSPLIEAIDRALIDVLGGGSEDYRAILSAIAEKLSAEIGE